MQARLVDHDVRTVADLEGVRVETVRTTRGYDNGFEVDRVEVHAFWCAANPQYGEPEGWSVQVSVKGWPLTAKGARDKRVSDRTSVYDVPSWPEAVHEAARAAYDLALSRGIRWQEVLGDDGKPGTTLTLL